MIDKSDLYQILSIKDDKGSSVYIIDLLKAFARWSLNGIDIENYKSTLHHDEPKRLNYFYLSDDVGLIIDKAIAQNKIKDPIGFCLFHAIIFNNLQEHEIFKSRFVCRTYHKYKKRIYVSQVNKLFTNFVNEIIKSILNGAIDKT